MNLLPFRDHHLLKLLKGYSAQNLPLDLFISNYFKQNKSLGSKDRGAIADTAYKLIRWQALIDYLIPEPTWEKRLALMASIDFDHYRDDSSIPVHIRHSFPKVLFDLIIKSHGMEQGSKLCYVSNQVAPVTVRINPAKTTREAMIKRWESLYQITPCKHAENGIIFLKKINFFGLPEFKEGLFEVQDEGSQLLSLLVHPEPGQQVMDFCAGSGGKTLAFAHVMQGKGQIYLHDTRSHALLEARKRLKRAGIQNAQTVEAQSPVLKKLKKKMDWVLVDAPCTGTGTLRRNPDMKWKFDETTLPRLVGQQRTIFEKALSFLKPEGHIVYGTCSILQEENQEQIAHFIKTYNLEMIGNFFQTLPSENGMDGFFGAVLKQSKGNG